MDLEERLKEVERKLRDTELRLLEAERASSRKDDLLATLSHALRTPLTSILGWAYLMRIRPPTSDELAKGLEIVERNARLQTQLIEDLLDKDRVREDPAPSEFRAIDLRGVRVLAVDDQPDACELVERVLEECGAWVVTAPGGQSALELLPEARPDVLITDIGMAGMDGYELLRRVRALPDKSLQGIPVIAMTAYARSGDRSRALHSGFQVHIAKPVEPAELVATVASVTGRTDLRL